ncbi:hypothetical protein [Vibrio cincinnatiensis]|uniref:hypothetical protein n=1 Tax=Vibrio cincinnatiensis TaxID=675 RepID=UPI0012ACEE44|nr:hypothetical protein [Vibrio cincinnatiensis]
MFEDFKRFIVDDLSSSNGTNQIIFVLESPHTNELIHKHPIAGQAGERMSGLFEILGLLSSEDAQLPLGCQIKRGVIENVAIINAAPIPLDKKIYCRETINLELIESLSGLKQRLEKRTQASYKPQGYIEQNLLSDFYSRLNAMIKPSTNVIVPLGNFASNFVKALQPQSVKIVYGVNHPSASTWKSENSLNSLRKAMACIQARS